MQTDALNKQYLKPLNIGLLSKLNWWTAWLFKPFGVRPTQHLSLWGNNANDFHFKNKSTFANPFTFFVRVHTAMDIREKRLSIIWDNGSSPAFWKLRWAAGHTYPARSTAAHLRIVMTRCRLQMFIAVSCKVSKSMLGTSPALCRQGLMHFLLGELENRTSPRESTRGSPGGKRFELTPSAYIVNFNSQRCSRWLAYWKW